MSTAEAFADFTTSGGAVAPFEAFEAGWLTNEDTIYAHVDPGVGATLAAYGPGSLIVGGKTVENFEELWSANQDTLYALGATESATFDGESKEDFEDGWNNSAFESLADVSTATADFDAGGGTAETFDWHTLINDLTGITNTCSFDITGVPESVEDFEEVYEDRQVSTTPGSATITTTTAHSLTASQYVWFYADPVDGGALPAPLVPNAPYFVATTPTATTFTLTGVTLTEPTTGKVLMYRDPANFWHAKMRTI